MAIYHEDILPIELESGQVNRSFLHHALSRGDAGGYRFGVSLFRNGNAESAGGATCMGYFIRHADMNTIVLNGGTFSGNKGSVTLPASCFAQAGSFTLVVKAVGGGVTGAMRIIDGTILDDVQGTIIDPGSAVPDLTALMNVISRAESAASTIGGIRISAELISGENYRIRIARS